MSQKRLQRDEGNSSDDTRPRKSPSFKSVVLDVMNIQRLQNFMVPVLEPLIRRVVKEEVDLALTRYIVCMKQNCVKDIHPSESRSLQLQFLNPMSLPVFTGTRIEGEGGYNIEVALVDSRNGIVVSHGLESSVKVEIVVLEGDFDGDERGHWTSEEFKVNVVREREGKKPLLCGDIILTLRAGRGSIGDIFFTDNSSWTRSRKFRLGARLLDDIGDVRVMEARSEPFTVRDHRGELYKKHYPPSLLDEVWRIEKIGKDGAFHRRLKKEGINTVQDFLVLFFLDPTRLRNILGSGMSTKMWEVTVEHARTCVVDKKLLLYNTSDKNGIVFNVVGQANGLLSNGIYVSADDLSDSEKVEACQMVMKAFGDREKIIPIDDEFPSPGISIPEPSEQRVGSFMSPLYSDFCFQDMNTVDTRFGFRGQGEGLLCDTENITRSFFGNENLQFFDADSLIPASDFVLPGDLQSAINALLPCSKGWSLLLSVLRWCFSIKRIVARKGNRRTMRYIQ